MVPCSFAQHSLKRRRDESTGLATISSPAMRRYSTAGCVPDSGALRRCALIQSLLTKRWFLLNHYPHPLSHEVCAAMAWTHHS